jgi:hypothetical protein
LSFQGQEPVINCLKTGDYSIEGFEDVWTCEHKSISDLIGTCDNSKPKCNRDRFQRELARMKATFDFYCIVISGKRSDLLPECHRIKAIQHKEGKRRVMCPETRAKGVEGSLKAFRADFNCHFYFMGSRENAAAFILDNATRFMRHK